MTFPSKTEIKKFQKQVEQYQEYVDGVRILRYFRRRQKFAIRVWIPRWLRVKKFKENYLKKHGFPYKNKKTRKKEEERARKKSSC